MLTLNALTAADGVFIPMQCEYYALEGLSALVATVDRLKKTVNPRLEIEGLLRTMFDPRNNLANEVSAQLIMHFGDKVYRTMIPRNVRLRKRRASACRRSSTIPPPAGRWPTWPWPARCCAAARSSRPPPTDRR